MNRTLVLFFLLPLAAIVSTIGSCADDPRNSQPVPLPWADSGLEGGPVDPCATPESGCPCDEPGEVIECGRIKRESADYIACSMGKRTCDNGYWGPCIGDVVAMVRSGPDDQARRSTQPGQAGAPPIRTLGLGVSQTCIDNPCDPYCVNYIDTPDGLDAGPGLQADDAGLSLTPDTTFTGGKDAGPPCTGIVVIPSPQVLTVTSLSPLITSPTLLDYEAQLTPMGCASGKLTTKADAAWSLDALDLAAITDTGTMSLYSPTAGPIKVFAYAGSWQGVGLANVVVNINETNLAPAGTAVQFVGAGSGVDTMVVRYPYDATVFPRGIKAPLIQWQTGGTPAQAVKISLRYPAAGTPIFNWSTIIPEPATYPQAAIPQAVWAAFDRAAQGNVATYVVQRLVGGVLKAEVTRTLRFSTTPLKGTIYYTEYSEDPVVYSRTAYERAIDVNNPTAAPVNPFAASGLAETDVQQCPVCHSVSANGRIFLTSDRTNSSNGGASAIDAAGKFTLLGDISSAPNKASDWRGFSWAAVTPDGKYSLTGPNAWGNTDATPPREAGGNGIGLRAEYFNNTTLAGMPTVTPLNRTINYAWGTAAPATGVSASAFSARWSGVLQAARTDLYTFQTEVNGGARLYIDGVNILDKWTDTGLVQWHTAQINLVTGKKYAIVLEYLQTTGASRARLRWGSPNTPIAETLRVVYGSDWFLDIIPQNQLYPPLAAAPPNGLLASYYPGILLAGTLANPGFSRYDLTASFASLGLAPAPGIPATNFSARWTGRLQAPSGGSYTFQTVAKDGVRLWINKRLIINRWSPSGTNALPDTSAPVILNAGQIVDIKIDFYGTTGTKLAMAVNWKLPGAAAFTAIPTANLFPTGDDGTPDVTFDGSLKNPEDFVMWQLTNTSNTPQAPVQVGSGPPPGLADVAMMIPSFSPDGKKLVFIDGDNGGGAGWRKGMSTFDFNAATRTFSNRKQLRNTWPQGEVMKWPAFEPDSKSIIFNNSSPGDYCNCSTPYGNMAPTNYHGVPGQLWSLDSSAVTPTAVPLTQTNQGELPEDADKSYQATMLPTVAGGYRWAVFTSTRPYGNLVNVAGTLAQDTSAQVWIAAIDDTVSGGADRSHPAFWLPNQNIQIPGTTRKYDNERAFWALDACKPAASSNQTVSSANLCQEPADCCGALATPPTAACKLDFPVGTPAIRHCVQVMGNICVPDGDACAGMNDCCNFPHTVCANNLCTVPPPPPSGKFVEAAFVRDYEGVCPIGTRVVWRFFDWQTVTPGDSKITFAVKTADTLADLGPLSSVAIGVASGPPITTWTGADVGKALLPLASSTWLRVTMTLTPTSDLSSSPTLTNWRQSYSCPPSE